MRKNPYGFGGSKIFKEGCKKHPLLWKGRYFACCNQHRHDFFFGRCNREGTATHMCAQDISGVAQPHVQGASGAPSTTARALSVYIVRSLEFMCDRKKLAKRGGQGQGSSNRFRKGGPDQHVHWDSGVRGVGKKAWVAGRRAATNLAKEFVSFRMGSGTVAASREPSVGKIIYLF